MVMREASPALNLGEGFRWLGVVQEGMTPSGDFRSPLSYTKEVVWPPIFPQPSAEWRGVIGYLPTMYDTQRRL